jgi:hypothetical protein
MAQSATGLAVQVTRGWQIAFIATVVGSYVAQMSFITFTYWHSGYISSSTWVYQIVQWICPVLYVGLGLIFAYKRQKAWLNRLFLAVLVGLIGIVGYSAFQFWLNIIHYHLFASSTVSLSLWSTYGWDWAFMALAFAAYAGILAIASKRSHL